MKRNKTLYFSHWNCSKMLFTFLLSNSQMMALIRSLVIPTIWGNCARWNQGPPTPLRKWTNDIYQFYTTIAFISASLPPQSLAVWPRTLPPAAPENVRTLVDYQQQLTRSSQQWQNIISWLTIINCPSLKPSRYEIFSHPLITDALLWKSAQTFYSAYT